MPTEMRMSESVTPAASRICFGTPECVVLAGCEISVSVPPSETASLATFNASRKRKASASPPLIAKEKVEPGPLHWRS